MVSMTCSSLLLSLCLLACSSRSSADRICKGGGGGQEVREMLQVRRRRRGSGLERGRAAPVAPPHLILVLDDVRVDLVQGRHAVELVDVQPRLLRQVGTHVLVADGRHPGDVGVVPEGREPGLIVRLTDVKPSKP